MGQTVGGWRQGGIVNDKVLAVNRNDFPVWNDLATEQMADDECEVGIEPIRW